MATVLLVDDDTNALCALKELVGQEGYRVTTAANGAAALRTARAERPDVVVSDCMMPEMDGMDLSRAMRDDRTLAGVPVVLVSALVTPPPDVQTAGFLRKPFAVAQLLEIIDRLVTA
ncbi:response regulator [Paraburkholderia caballeronis]|uniref:Two-component system, chemotaxis family, sensor kinase CheA n=1 Tax=Paraburkholderia caballeronis TaxID=416943 RepID=A0A1H7J4S4_9BURK|nr:response regulator [Paraburkholderia caballeronis]PXW27562.1 response regulator receiver domain-containing protein [Paraburkholderia caballeronis]PXX03036.1 response regulator receiver domain-containing protein [Paraburkholderia caballeronis]RAK03761.1 response regulator receiver domain-containing protein [Paraburkholderia caballeronis]TDV21066.1 response regulator receiver domain-containing protein [Paraburkholderia caballeronis]TDV21495.1 response regulator receiver domain-containing prot